MLRVAPLAAVPKDAYVTRVCAACFRRRGEEVDRGDGDSNLPARAGGGGGSSIPGPGGSSDSDCIRLSLCAACGAAAFCSRWVSTVTACGAGLPRQCGTCKGGVFIKLVLSSVTYALQWECTAVHALTSSPDSVACAREGWPSAYFLLAQTPSLPFYPLAPLPPCPCSPSPSLSFQTFLSPLQMPRM